MPTNPENSSKSIETKTKTPKRDQQIPRLTDLEIFEISRLLKDFGYQLWSYPYKNAPGGLSLGVHLRETATGKHFDAEKTKVQRISGSVFEVGRGSFEIGIGSFEIGRGASINKSFGPALITLHDDNPFQPKDDDSEKTIKQEPDKVKTFFCYGATVQTGKTDEGTIVYFQSTAPILDLSNATYTNRFGNPYLSPPDAQASQLYAETRALFSKIGGCKLSPAEAKKAYSLLEENDPSENFEAVISKLAATVQDSRILRQSVTGKLILKVAENFYSSRDSINTQTELAELFRKLS